MTTTLTINDRLEASPAAFLTEVAEIARHLVDELDGGTAANVRRDAERLNVLAHTEAPAGADLDSTFAGALRSRATSVTGLAARSRSPLAIAQAANGVIRLIADHPDVFEDSAAPELLSLDYLEREAQLRSLAGQHLAVTAVVERAVAVWPRLRRRLIAAGANELAQQFDAHLEELSRHQSAAGIRDATRRGRQLIALMRTIVQGQDREETAAPAPLVTAA